MCSGNTTGEIEIKPGDEISVLNSLRRNGHVTWSWTKRKFDADSVNILSYEGEIWTLGYRLKEKLLSTEMGLWGRAEKNTKLKGKKQ